MIVDGSYMAWVRPTRRVHLALSVGMTVTGLVLAAMGMTGSREPVPPSSLLGRTADSAVSGGDGTPAGTVPAAPLVRFAPSAPAKPPVPTKPSAKPSPKPSVEPSVDPRPKPRSQPLHPSDLSRPLASAPPQSSERSPDELPAHPVKH